MTIKEVEQRAGITKANIRFYEKEGLLSPGRGENNYREYSEEDLRILEQIKFYRTLGLSIPAIRSLQAGQTTVGQLMDSRLSQIHAEMEELNQAEKMCLRLREEKTSPEQWDITLLSMQMNLWKKKGGVIMKQDRKNKKKQWEHFLSKATQAMVCSVLIINASIRLFSVRLPVAFQLGYVAVVLLPVILLVVVKNLDTE